MKVFKSKGMWTCKIVTGEETYEIMSELGEHHAITTLLNILHNGGRISWPLMEVR